VKKEEAVVKNDTSSKIAPEHLERAAYVYIRQSSPQQVEQHAESKRRQYQMVDWVEEMGWPRERIVVVDDDQGKSGAVARSRKGFSETVMAVGRGEVGIVVSLEVSRLARNSPDWHHLIYLCRWSRTLISDGQTIYDPQLSTDRMVLGIRGQVSEMELDDSIERMVEARWNKARRGEMMTIPVAGYELDDLNQLVMSSDESVTHAVETVFTKFDELGSGRQVFLWWLEQGLKYPVRRIELRTHPVVWMEAKYNMILRTLHNPVYAGVYVFGRIETVRELDPEDPQRLRVRRVPRRGEWPVLIEQHHPAYISYDKFLKNQERLRDNVRREGSNHPTAAREGQALLQGLVRCGRCGRAMHVNYGGGKRARRGKKTMQYRCKQAREQIGGADCQTIGGQRIDDAVVGAFLEASEPAGIEALSRLQEELSRERESVERYWKLQVERVRYEAERAQRQFDGVEPENRLVARELERRWNERLRELETLRQKAEQVLRQTPWLSEEEMARAQQLARNLEEVWQNETTTHRDKKRLLRCLIEEVQLTTEDERYVVRIVWKGQAKTELEVGRRAAGTDHKTSEDTIELVRQLAKEFDDVQIARILNKQGRRSGFGNPFTQRNVLSMRGRHKIPKCPTPLPKDPLEGPFTADEAALELGVAMSTIHRWLRDGILAGQQMTPGAPWRILLNDEVRRKLSGGNAPQSWVSLSEASRRLGLKKSYVAYLVKTGKLEGMQTTLRNRRRWRINVDSTTYGRQTELFDQMTNNNIKEA
jgi:DNA invertase Pin-like site-specific DNA recombinase